MSGFEMLSVEFQRVYVELCTTVPEVNEILRTKSESPIAKIAGQVIAEIAGTWKVVADMMEKATGIISTAGLDTRFTSEARSAAMNDAAATLAGTIDQLLTDAETAVARLAVDLAKAAMPARPPTTDPLLQEAQLAAIKTDIVMVLDRYSGDYVPTQAAELVAAYAAAGNDLGTWLLVSSGWSELYFKSRGADLDMFTLDIAKAMTGTKDPELTNAQQLLRQLSGPKGVRALITIARHAASMRLDDLRRSFGLRVA
jgi:hypothetical protein